MSEPTSARLGLGFRAPEHSAEWTADSIRMLLRNQDDRNFGLDLDKSH